MGDSEFADPRVPSFYDVYQDVDNWTNVSHGRRKAIKSALKSAASWCDVRMDRVLAHPQYLRRMLKSLRPSTVGVSPKRFANVRSEIMFVLKRIKVVDRYTYLAPLTTEWTDFWEEIPNKYTKRSMSRLVRYASAKDIAPKELNEKHIGRFVDALTEGSLVKDPHTVCRNAVRAWNRLVQQRPELGLTHIPMASRRDKYRLPETAFPASFVRDVDASLERQRSSDPFDRDAPPRALRESTLVGYRDQLFRIASALVLSGHDPNKIVDLNYLIRLEHVEAALRHVLDRRVGKEPKGQAAQMARLLAKIARHWAKAPMEQVDALNEFASRLAPRCEGLSTKNRRGLLPFRDQTNLVKVFLLPSRIVEAVDAGVVRGRMACLRMQQAVALSILVNCPLRIGNLATLRLDRHLHWSGKGMTGKLMVMLDEEEVKNSQQLVFPLPRETADLIRRYVEDYRDGLLLPPSPFLFPGEDSARAKQTACLGRQLTNLTHDAIGFRCNPHLYRHLVHLVVLRKFPAAYGMVSRVLGHKRLETTLTNYAHEATAIAMSVYQELVTDVSHPLWSGRDGNLETFANSANDGLL